MNSIGELLIARGRLVELSNQRADPDLEDLVIRVSHLTANLQSDIIQARMTPGWQVFDRFPRLVRDVSRRLGKRVEFEIEGKEIELDRSILDELGDPLVHLLRNAVDHGLETPAEREAAGKPPVGRVVLSAVRERSTVVIRVEDDGRGIDRNAVLADAKAKGIVDEEAEVLTDDVLLRVLARPGFSTAQAVSDVSGRGVGIDVVMTRLRSFGGSVELRTAVGQGTSFTLRLPPTLAIVPALLAHVGAERYALPLTHVEETVDFDQQVVTTVDGTDAIVLRNEVVPLVRLRNLVALSGTAPRRQPVIILQIGDRRTGVVVDQLGGQREIVVKTFDAPRGTVPIFSGVTILGDGAVVFILDAARLM
jgi:two-component system chemotaxis sensor kinase CheA